MSLHIVANIKTIALTSEFDMVAVMVESSLN